MHAIAKIILLPFQISLKILFFPFILLWGFWRGERSDVKKIVGTVSTLFLLLPFWILLEFGVGVAAWSIAPSFGLRKITIPTSGSSMRPAIQEHDSLSVNIYPGIGPWRHTFTYGDVIVFQNQQSDEYLKKDNQEATGLVKRVIGLPGDTITLRDGFVYRNGELTQEPYTLKPRSTFGGEIIRECQEIKIGVNEILVLGDNRKQSADSRHLGLVKLGDIRYYRSYSDQGEFKARWRDASADRSFAQQTTLDTTKFIELLNAKRKAARRKELKSQDKLVASAKKRAEVMLKFDDLSFEATKSGYTMVKAMNEVGYSNIVWGEIPALGYYDAEELINYFFEFPKSRDFLLNSDFQETGISVTIGKVKNCPTQIIVQHLAGYLPPNYKQSDISSWREALDSLNSIIPSWEGAKGKEGLNQDEVIQLLNLLYQERDIASQILRRMEANQWLTRDEERSIKEFAELANRSSELAKKLNQD